jgi:Domain of unknown function (DUF5610)
MNTSNIPSSSTATQNRQNTSAQNKQPSAELTQAQQQKESLNVSILKSTNASLGVKDESLSLLLNTTIDKINEFLVPEFGEDAIQKAADSGLDVSPEATAERIVSLSTAFFGAFKEQHSEETEEVVLEKFMNTIGSGIDQGFTEARDILEGLKVLEGKVASDINDTYSLVQSKLNAFETMIKDLV